jgi:uncharacterized membrane protein
MAFCPTCGSQIPAGATACPSCGGGGGTAVATQSSGLTDNVAGMLAYVTIIPAIVFLVLEPYNQRRFIRFHSFQNIFFVIAWIVLGVALSIVAAIPVLGWLTLLIWPLVGLGGLAIWVIMLIKAYQGKMFKLPIIGDIAEKQAGPA